MNEGRDATATPWESPRPSCRRGARPRCRGPDREMERLLARPRRAPCGARLNRSMISTCWSASSSDTLAHPGRRRVLPLHSSRHAIPAQRACRYHGAGCCFGAARMKEPASAAARGDRDGPIARAPDPRNYAGVYLMPPRPLRSRRGKYSTRSSSFPGENPMADLPRRHGSRGRPRIRSGRSRLEPPRRLPQAHRRGEGRPQGQVLLDRDARPRVAVQRDVEAREGRFHGPLHGVPRRAQDI